MHVLEIVSTSWPLAFMFVALCATGIIMYLIQWFKRSNLEDKAHRASQAVVVRNREDY